MTAASTTEKEPQAALEAPVAEEPKAPIPQHEIDEIIRKRVYGAVALGMAPVPLLDLVGLYAIQVELVRALAEKHGVPFRADLTKTLLGSLVGTVLPVGLAPAFFSLFKLIPVIGWTASASTLCIVGGASTYAVGRVFEKHFASGGTLLNVETDKIGAAFKEKYEEGKSFVGKLRKKPAPAEQAEAPAAS
jgi:uncharacterized protein (DUF697 family)